MKTQSQNRKSRVLSLSAITLATALALGTGMQVYAAEKTPAPAATQTAPNKAENDALYRYSQAGRNAIDEIVLARSHLNDGRPDLARGELNKAQMALLTAKAEAPTFVDQTRIMVQGKQVGEESSKVHSDLIPVSNDVVLAENFKLTKKHEPILAKAKEFLAKGDHKRAAETLKAGDVDVVVNRIWMPIGSTEKLLDKAISQVAKKDYYDANLTLKTIRDSLQVDTVKVDVPPGASS